MSQSGKPEPLRIEMPFQETLRRLLRVKKEEIQAPDKRPGKSRASGKDNKTPEQH